MIAHVLDTDRAAEVALPCPRTAEPAGAGTVPVPAPADTTSSARDPFLVATRLEESAAVLAWVGRLVLLVALGLVVAFVLVP
jgi:hypothetical protein